MENVVLHYNISTEVRLMRRPALLRPLLIACLWLASITFAWAEAPRVVTTIKPVHLLALAVMDGIATPERLLPDGASPHAYTLRPSDMRRLEEADLVLWMGPELETFLQRPLAGLNDDTRHVALLQTPGLQRWPARAGGVWERQDGHGHDHDEHAMADGGGHPDPHVWLDPGNGILIAARISSALGELDPTNADRYRLNLQRLESRIGRLDEALSERLSPFHDAPYIVFHDAYQYFERHYALSPAGALSVTPGVTPGVKRLREIQARIRETGARCVFAEPQFKPALVDMLTRDTGVRSATLDPLGTAVSDDADGYAALLTGIADALAGCLSAAASP